ncbi:DUF3853 family protein [bacterium]|nr:DUF3853 family protein [bacterium]MBD5401167.1 DUF3853 family protein [bacterium]
MKTIIKGNKALAQTLGVHHQTVQKWRKKGILRQATIAERGRVIIYDLDKAIACLQNNPAKPERRSNA